MASLCSKERNCARASRSWSFMGIRRESSNSDSAVRILMRQSSWKSLSILLAPLPPSLVARQHVGPDPFGKALEYGQLIFFRPQKLVKFSHGHEWKESAFSLSAIRSVMIQPIDSQHLAVAPP